LVVGRRGEIQLSLADDKTLADLEGVDPDGRGGEGQLALETGGELGLPRAAERNFSAWRRSGRASGPALAPELRRERAARSAS